MSCSIEEESAFLALFLEKASKGGILIVGENKRALDKRFAKKLLLLPYIISCVFIIGGSSLRTKNIVLSLSGLCRGAEGREPGLRAGRTPKDAVTGLKGSVVPTQRDLKALPLPVNAESQALSSAHGRPVQISRLAHCHASRLDNHIPFPHA